MDDDPYAVLGVPHDAAHADIKRAYRQRARELHPDVNADTDAGEQFKRLSAAHDILSDPTRRAAFDTARGRQRATGELPEEFMDAVANAIDRAQIYAERLVVPLYSRHWRGAGSEMVARLIRDLEALGDPLWLQGAVRPLDRWRAQRLLKRVVLTLDLRPSARLSEVYRDLRGATVILVTPWALHRQGFRDGAELDDAILRLVLSRVVQVLASDRLGALDLSADDLVERARARDAQVRQRVWGQRLLYAAVAGFLGVMMFAGYAGW